MAGRPEDALLYKGYTVDPHELEQLLLARRGVLDVVVVGRSVPGVGEIPVAFVVAETTARITAEELIEFMAATVPPYKKVREVVFVDELPLSPRGAVLRSALRDRLNDVHAGQSTEK
jgi:long-chain acyl-CoA synthetase